MANDICILYRCQLLKKRRLITYCSQVKEVPLFLIAHNSAAKSDGKYILCTKKPSFLAKLVEFNDEEDFKNYTDSTQKYYQKLPNRNAILELTKSLDSDILDIAKIEKLYKKMVIWFVHYGETKA